MLPCHVVQDLLPGELEGLNDAETSALIAEHLAQCEHCRAAKAAMEAELALQKAPPKRPNPFSQYKHRQIIAALLSLLLAALASLWLYGTEYHVDASSLAYLEAAIAEEGSQYIHNDVHVIDTRERGDTLFVYYTYLESDDRCGVALLEKGFLGKYRFLSRGTYNAPLSIGWAETGGHTYLVLAEGTDLIHATSFTAFAVKDGIEEALYTGRPNQSVKLFYVAQNDSIRDADALYVRYYDENGAEMDVRDLYESRPIGITHGNIGRSVNRYNDYWLMVFFFLIAALFAGYFLGLLPGRPRRGREWRASRPGLWAGWIGYIVLYGLSIPMTDIHIQDIFLPACYDATYPIRILIAWIWALLLLLLILCTIRALRKK